MLKFAVQSLLTTAVLTACLLASADQHQKLPKIGVLLGTNPSTAAPYDKAFRDGLRDLGYINGDNVIIVARYAQGDTTRYPALLHELIALEVDVLFVAPRAIFAAKEATSTIPIVCPGFQSDLVAAGLIDSLSHPGANVTGLYPMGSETDDKLLQLAIELMPNLQRLGLLFEASPDLGTDAGTLRLLAKRAGVTLRTYGVRDLDEILQALAAMRKERLQAFIVWNTPLTILHRKRIMTSSALSIPVIGEADWAETGAVVTYSADPFEQWRRSALYVDKILKGANAGDLPIEQSTKLKLVVNLKAAKALGIKIPGPLLARADEIIQ